MLQGRPEWAALLEKLGAFQSACAALPNCLDQVNDALAQVIGSETAAPEALAQLKSAAEDLLAAGQAFGQAGAELAKALMNVAPGQGPDLTAAYQKLQDASQQLTDTQEEVENILKDLGASEAERDQMCIRDRLSGELHYRITGSGGLCQQGAGRAGSGWDAPSLSSHPNGGEHHSL